MIKQEFGNNSPHKKVHDVTTALIRIGINTMPSTDTMIKFLYEEWESINPETRLELTRDKL